jgi:ABC-type branched-subunit amino acid transport system substrate-binding protein
VERFQKRWSRLPNYSAETTYSAIYITKLALEKGKSLETDSVLAALTGMRILTPAGLRVYRAEDHQFVYNVPAGRVVWNAKYPIPVLGDLVVIPASEYWRSPPFTAVPVGK